MLEIKLTKRDWMEIAAVSLVFSILIVAATLTIDYPNLMKLEGDLFWAGLSNDLFIPLILGTPTFVLLFSKIRQLARAKLILEELAYTDSLTGALNRRAFQSRVESILAGGPHNHVALLVIDLDNFKTINDNYGHDVGDQALMAVADTVSKCLRENAVFGRIGGEEFVLFIPDTTAPMAALGAEQVRLAIESSSFSQERLAGKLTTSVGVATAATPLSFQELYREADACLYQAKASGRNKVILKTLADGETDKRDGASAAA